jgi:hypothetical protein
LTALQPVVIGDIDTAASSLVVTGTSSDTNSFAKREHRRWDSGFEQNAVSASTDNGHGHGDAASERWPGAERSNHSC